MLAEAVSKVEKLEQTKTYCRNCRTAGHDARNCPQPCKNCNGSAGTHPFWRCPQYLAGKPQPVAEHVLLEDEYGLEDLYAQEELPSEKHARKRVRVEDIEDQDEVRFVETSQTSRPTAKPAAKPRKQTPRPKKVKPENTEPTITNKAAVQLMDEAKIGLTLAQICAMAPGFRAEVRRLLVKPRKPKIEVVDSTLPSIRMDNLLMSTGDDENGCCPRTTIRVNDKYFVNALLDGGAVPSVISLELVKRLGIQELHKAHSKYITANGEKSEALGIAQNISIQIMGQKIKIAAIVYNHSAFPLLLGRRAMKSLKISTEWETCLWTIKTEDGKFRLPINFNTTFGVRTIPNGVTIEEESDVDSEMESESDIKSESDDEEFTDNEVFILITNDIHEKENGDLEIQAGKPEIQTDSSSESEQIENALEKVSPSVAPEYKSYIPDLKKLLWEYLDIFGISHNNLKQTSLIEFDIEIGDTKPSYIKSRFLPYKYKEFVKKELETAVKAGIMSGPLKTLCRWGSPVWAVLKPKTNELRMVGDFRVLNSKTTTDGILLSDLQETIEQLAEAKIYSPLDFLKAYHQIKVTPAAREKLVLATEFGNFQYNIMPFGLKNASATFAKAMQQAFEPVVDITATYFDDVTVHSVEVTKHLDHLRRVFDIIRKYNFTLRPEKCLFFQDQIELLGYTINPTGIKPNCKLLNKVKIFDMPQGKTDVKAFVHLCGFYSNHIQNFAEIASPLTELLKKNTKFEMKELQVQV